MRPSRSPGLKQNAPQPWLGAKGAGPWRKAPQPRPKAKYAWGCSSGEGTLLAPRLAGPGLGRAGAEAAATCFCLRLGVRLRQSAFASGGGWGWGRRGPPPRPCPRLPSRPAPFASCSRLPCRISSSAALLHNAGCRMLNCFKMYMCTCHQDAM